jgi:hypothetical protein
MAARSCEEHLMAKGREGLKKEHPKVRAKLRVTPLSGL